MSLKYITLPVRLFLVGCCCSSYAMHIGSNDLQDYESMIPAVDYVSLFTLRNTINYMETKLLWMIGQHHHEWSHARRSLVSAMHERIRTLSHIPISVNLPDLCTFRAIHFDVRSDYPTMTFAFTSRKRNGPSFLFEIITHHTQMTKVLKGRGTQHYMHSVVVPFGKSLNGTLLLMAHPNGLGIQIFVDDIELLSTAKVLKFGKSPVDIAIHQSPNVSAVTDMYCLSPKDFCSQYPSRRSAWTDIQVQIVGKSVFPLMVLTNPLLNRGPGMTDAVELQKRRKSSNPSEPILLSTKKAMHIRRRRRDSTTMPSDIGSINLSETSSCVPEYRTLPNAAAESSFFATLDTRHQKTRRSIDEKRAALTAKLEFYLGRKSPCP